MNFRRVHCPLHRQCQLFQDAHYGPHTEPSMFRAETISDKTAWSVLPPCRGEFKLSPSRPLCAVWHSCEEIHTVEPLCQPGRCQQQNWRRLLTLASVSLLIVCILNISGDMARGPGVRGKRARSWRSNSNFRESTRLYVVTRPTFRLCRHSHLNHYSTPFCLKSTVQHCGEFRFAVSCERWQRKASDSLGCDYFIPLTVICGCHRPGEMDVSWAAVAVRACLGSAHVIWVCLCLNITTLRCLVS